MAEKFTTINDYIASFPAEVQLVLEDLRARAHAAAPGAEETISYGIPTLRLDGRILVHFAGWKDHVSIYPVPEGDEQLTRELAAHQTGRGTLRFPLDQPLPDDLIDRVLAQHVLNRRAT